MIVTEKNLRAADKIIDVLTTEKCTISEAESILTEVLKGIRYSSMVQKANYQERFKDALEQQE